MDGEVIVSAAAGLLGTMVGAATVLIQGSLQHKRDSEDRLRTEARERSRTAAQTLDQLVEQQASDVADEHADTSMENPESRARIDRVAATWNRLDALVVDLPQPWRSHLAEGIDYLRWADDFGRDTFNGGYHYDTVRTITNEIAKSLHVALAAFLRNELELPSETARWIEYRAACVELLRAKEEEHAEMIAESAERRDAWLAEHPQVRDEIERRQLKRYEGS